MRLPTYNGYTVSVGPAPFFALLNSYSTTPANAAPQLAPAWTIALSGFTIRTPDRRWLVNHSRVPVRPVLWQSTARRVRAGAAAVRASAGRERCIARDRRRQIFHPTSSQHRPNHIWACIDYHRYSIRQSFR